MMHVLPSEIRISCCYFSLHVYSFLIKSVPVGLKHLSISSNHREIAEDFGGPFS